METTYKYKAFISYSHQDQKFAKWLHKRIENYKIPKSLREKYPDLPKDLKRTIFLDDEELPTASALPDNLSHALESSELLIVVCSPNATQSYWVDKEIAYFKQYHGEGKVLAVLSSGEPNATYSSVYDAKQEAFPKSLRYKVKENGELTEERTEPLAADARKGANKKKALIKLIAGILKVDFADLWERDKKEKRKRRIIIGLILTLFIALSIYASVQFLGEQGNKELEQIKTKIADIEYKIRHDELPMEKVIALNKKLKKLKKDKENKEDTQKFLGKQKESLNQKKVRAYEQNGPSAALEVSSKALARREQSRKKFSLEDIFDAKMHVELYEFEKAEESYENAIALFFDYETVIGYATFLEKQNQHKRALVLYERLLNLKITLKRKTSILNRQGVIFNTINQLKKSEHSYLDALTIYKKLEKNMPGTYTEELSDIYNNLGILYSGMERFTDSENAYTESILLTRYLTKINEKKYKPMLALFLNNLGGFYLENNKFEQAKEVLLKSLEIYRDLNTTDPYMGLALNNLGIIYAEKNYIDQSEKSYLEALVLYRELDKYNPSAYHYYVAMVLNNLALLYHKTHQLKKSEKAFLEAITRRKTLANLNPEAYSIDVPRTLYNLALLYSDMEQLEKSEVIYLEALALYKVLAQDHPGNNHYMYNVGITLNNLTNIYFVKHQMDKAKNYYMKTLNIRKILAKENPNMYSVDYASTIVMGVDLFEQPAESLDNAEIILQKFNNNPKAKRFLNIIDDLRK